MTETLNTRFSEYGEKTPGTLIGTLTHDLDLRFTAEAKEVCNFSVAVNSRFRNDDGEWEDNPTEFHRCTAWEHTASHMAASLQRGDRIVAVGFFRDHTWIDSNGEKRTDNEFTATEIGPSLKFVDVSVKRVRRGKS
jgi:single-strand DNA-binding protein